MAQTQVRENAPTTVATKAPFGAIYFGAILALIGTLLTLSAMPEMQFVAISGVLLICTGMIQRTIHRLYEG